MALTIRSSADPGTPIPASASASLVRFIMLLMSGLMLSSSLPLRMVLANITAIVAYWGVCDVALLTGCVMTEAASTTLPGVVLLVGPVFLSFD